MQNSEFQLQAAIEDSHWWFMGRREILWQLIQRTIHPLPRSLLEIGCGTGGNLRFFADKIPHRTGCDIAPEAIRLARQLTDGADLQLCDFRALPASVWQTSDLILLADVLEHVPEDRPFLSDLLARMRPGAHLLITVPAHRFLWSAHDHALGHQRRYHPRELHALLPNSGIEILHSSPFNTLWFPAIALVRWLNRGGGGSDLAPLPPLLNRLLYRVFRLERRLVGNLPLPIGVSHVLLLRKTAP